MIWVLVISVVLAGNLFLRPILTGLPKTGGSSRNIIVLLQFVLLQGQGFLPGCIPAGGRDVKDAPGFEQYGFDEHASTYESPDPDPLITATNWIWSDKDSIKRWGWAGRDRR